jgi:glycine oxidase
VIGGGLIGMLTACFLHEEGADVTLLERKRLGSESSWAGGGILSPLYPWRYPKAVTRLAEESQRLYPQYARALQEETGIDPEYICSGLLVLDMEDRAEAQHWGIENNTSMELLEGNALRKCEESLAQGFDRGLWMPTIGQIRNPRLVKALRASLEIRKIKYIEHRKAISLSIHEGEIKGVKTALETHDADKVLIAGGAWSGQLIPQGLTSIPVEPVLGQMILFRAPPNALQRIVLYRGHYAIPRSDGRILVGSTLEYVGFNKRTSEEALGVLSDAAVEIIPSILKYPIEHHWAGLRPGTSSGIPFIGAHPEIKGLYYNCGHFRNGVVLGLSSARLAADLLLEKTPSIESEAYDLKACQ